jgi:translation initiation factor 2B subunit (eIF-2B alpha/beta/delta family)
MHITTARPSVVSFEAEMNRKSDRKLVSFRLPEDLMNDLRSRADEEESSVTDLVCRLLRQGMKSSPDDRISALEDEIQELRKQLKQANFSHLSSAQIYTPIFPQPRLQSAEDENATKQQIDQLSLQLSLQMQEEIAKLEAKLEKVLTHRWGDGDEVNKLPIDPKAS